jgi:hypothetical protein
LTLFVEFGIKALGSDQGPSYKVHESELDGNTREAMLLPPIHLIILMGFFYINCGGKILPCKNHSLLNLMKPEEEIRPSGKCPKA